jgi:hypothetical protein
MQLWTEYEGVTIDGAYPLNKLLLPEGRSAFFSTANGKGDPVVLRLIECHFDEDEILGRWRSIDSLNHPNFLKLERFGKIELDGGPVVYAVFEKVDANLAGVLDKGHLNVKETAQLAISLTSALEMLHSNGFFHGHLAPGGIFAVGEVVKLRSDCIREAMEGDAGTASKRRDIRDLALVLLQALTQRISLEGLPESAVPPPFDKIVRYGMNGTWGLQEIRAALEGRIKPSVAPAISRPAVAVPPKKEVASEVQAKPSSSTEADQSGSWLSKPFQSASREDLREGQNRWTFLWKSKRFGIGGAVAVLLLLSCWLVVHSWRGRHTASEPSVATSVLPEKTTAQQHPTPIQRVNVVPAENHGVTGRDQWRVVAYTYRRQEQAQKKADSLAQKQPDLAPAVFTPNGHAPYLVTVGGVMGKDEAYGLARRSRKLGLPRDTYAQNYSGGGR